MLLHKDIQLKVFYLDVPGKIRLIRQLQREKNPDIPEIYRRYIADDEDFGCLEFKHEQLPNTNSADFEYSWNRILAYAQSWAKNDNK